MIVRYLRALGQASIDGWNRFWFSSTDPAPLSVIRIAIGLLLFYSHAVWALNSESFFGASAWLDSAAVSAIQSEGYAGSALWWVDQSPRLMTMLHGIALLNAVLLTVGLWSRVAAPVAFLLTASFANRNPAALYGFDQVLGFVTLYLCVNPGHGWLSVDAWRKDSARHADGLATKKHTATQRGVLVSFCASLWPALPTGSRSRGVESVSATVATRLIQLHLCLIYLVAGLAKLKGAAWWSGVAFWGAIGNLEYQTLDMTWLVDWPMVVSLLTVSALAWEISYAALIWNRWTRPLVLAFGVLVHAGIAVCFGMMTFGLSMIVANVAFVSPTVIRSLVGRNKADPWAVALERSSGIPYSEEPRVAIATASVGSPSNDATRRELLTER